jgi:hypothetical protein
MAMPPLMPRRRVIPTDQELPVLGATELITGVAMAGMPPGHRQGNSLLQQALNANFRYPTFSTFQILARGMEQEATSEDAFNDSDAIRPSFILDRGDDYCIRVCFCIARRILYEDMTPGIAKFCS